MSVGTDSGTRRVATAPSSSTRVRQSPSPAPAKMAASTPGPVSRARLSRAAARSVSPPLDAACASVATVEPSPDFASARSAATRIWASLLCVRPAAASFAAGPPISASSCIARTPARLFSFGSRAAMAVAVAGPRSFASRTTAVPRICSSLLLRASSSIGSARSLRVSASPARPAARRCAAVCASIFA